MLGRDVHHGELADNGLLVFRLQIEALEVEEAVEAKEQFLATLQDNPVHHLLLRGRLRNGRRATQTFGTQQVDVGGGCRQIELQLMELVLSLLLLVEHAVLHPLHSLIQQLVQQK